MGFAGNSRPLFVLPTSIQSNSRNTSALADLDYQIGLSSASAHSSLVFPIRHGTVSDWDAMEKYWSQCIFKYLKVEPEDHPFLLTEPPMNSPENREQTAEIMFEGFGVKALHIGVQAVLALAAGLANRKEASLTLTGTVVDSGDGVTHVIPVVDGYAIASAIKSVPIAGKEVTLFIQSKLRESGLSGEDTFELAGKLKEFCKVSPDIKSNPKNVESRSITLSNGRTFSVCLPDAEFLAPEIFFDPSLIKEKCPSLPEMVDSCVQACPIDTRRGLYGNVVLSGGSTLFKDFQKRLQRDLRHISAMRQSLGDMFQLRLKGDALAKEALNAKLDSGSLNVPVNVFSHKEQKYAVWHGGSLLASLDSFPSVCHSKAEYDELGPSICRQSRVFGSMI